MDGDFLGFGFPDSLISLSNVSKRRSADVVAHHTVFIRNVRTGQSSSVVQRGGEGVQPLLH